MNLLCPNCQKMLTVPEQYAGQLMKCPLCSGTFTVPSLPQSGPAPAATPAAAAPAGAGGTPAPVDGGASPAPAPASESPLPPEVYSFESAQNSAAAGAPGSPPASDSAPASAPAPDVLAPSAERRTPAPSPDAAVPPGPSLTHPVVPPREGYHRTSAITFSPRVLRWVPPVAVVLIFFLQFFPWVGWYSGGVPGVTQGAWGSAFGVYSVDDEVAPWARKDVPEDARNGPTPPGWGLLMIFYLLVFLVTLVATVGVLVLNFVDVKLPPAVEQLLPWRWGIVAALNLLVFFFLALQLVVDFSLEAQVRDYAGEVYRKARDAKQSDKEAQRESGRWVEDLRRTVWLKLAFVLHLLALACAALMFWIGQRPEGRPLPRLELMW